MRAKVRVDTAERLLTRDQQVHRIRVARVESDAAIAADQTRYPHTEIVAIDRREFSLWKTIGGVYLLVGVVLAVWR